MDKFPRGVYTRRRSHTLLHRSGRIGSCARLHLAALFAHARTRDVATAVQYLDPAPTGGGSGGYLEILAPNRFVLDWIRDKYGDRIRGIVHAAAPERRIAVSVGVGSLEKRNDVAPTVATVTVVSPDGPAAEIEQSDTKRGSGLKADFTFETFVEGKSNQLARAASLKLLKIQGKDTTLCSSAGRRVGQDPPHACRRQSHSAATQGRPGGVPALRAFRRGHGQALQHNAINEFKRYYRSVDALLIDDIQFFAGKERSRKNFSIHSMHFSKVSSRSC